MKIETVRRHAMSMEAVTEEPHHQYSSFRVRGKIFVTIPTEEDAIHVFVDEQHREQALSIYPEFTEKLLWGGKVVGLRLTLKSAKPNVVRTLVSQAYTTRVAKDAGPMVAAPKKRKTKR